MSARGHGDDIAQRRCVRRFWAASRPHDKLGARAGLTFRAVLVRKRKCAVRHVCVTTTYSTSLRVLGCVTPRVRQRVHRPIDRHERRGARQHASATISAAICTAMDLSWDIPLARASAKRKTPDSKRTAALRKRPASSTPCVTLIRPGTHGSEHTQLESIVRSPPLPPIFIPLPKVRRIGSMCAGMLSEHWALTGEFVHTFAVEIAPFARRFAHANAHIERMFSDVSADEFLKNVPDHDVLSAGFPCQSFSTAGRGRGRDDPRGSIYKHVLHVVARRMPRIVIMENVKGLVERHSEVLLDITETLKSLVDPLTGKQCYKVFVKVLNSADFRLPQRRERVYIVAVKLCGRPADTVTLRWPTPSPRRPKTRTRSTCEA